jgi:hypothetical protein
MASKYILAEYGVIRNEASVSLDSSIRDRLVWIGGSAALFILPMFDHGTFLNPDIYRRVVLGYYISNTMLRRYSP